MSDNGSATPHLMHCVSTRATPTSQERTKGSSTLHLDADHFVHALHDAAQRCGDVGHRHRPRQAEQQPRHRGRGVTTGRVQVVDGGVHRPQGTGDLQSQSQTMTWGSAPIRQGGRGPEKFELTAHTHPHARTRTRTDTPCCSAELNLYDILIFVIPVKVLQTTL